MTIEVHLWLDDVRPAPVGWVWARTVDEAKTYLIQGTVRRASLDHDLGACEPCMEIWRADPKGVMPNCSHFGTGYDLCSWMEETGHWPMTRPVVHSMNPEGRRRMNAVIARWHPPNEKRWHSPTKANR